MMIKEENYINIQGWMVTELNLKGNELLIYAIIYGFSQLEGQTYDGGLQYLADWTNSTKQGVIKNLKSLIDKGLINKKESVLNNIKFCEYYSTKFNGVLNKVEYGGKQSLTGGIKQSLTNNTIINNNNDNINNNNDDNNILDNSIIKKENTKRKKDNQEILTEEEVMFNEFWEMYPKSINKKGCKVAFLRIENLKETFPLIKEDLIRKCNSKQWKNTQYIPHPLTYIHQERWKDKTKITAEEQIKNIDMRNWGV